MSKSLLAWFYSYWIYSLVNNFHSLYPSSILFLFLIDAIRILKIIRKEFNIYVEMILKKMHVCRRKCLHSLFSHCSEREISYIQISLFSSVSFALNSRTFFNKILNNWKVILKGRKPFVNSNWFFISWVCQLFPFISNVTILSHHVRYICIARLTQRDFVRSEI